MMIGSECVQCGCDTEDKCRKRYCHTCAPADQVNGKGERSNFKWCNLIRLYGVDKFMFDAMYFEQDGKCLICLDREATHVDHCHKTGRVRGLLCAGCNGHLGWMEMSGALDRALDYVAEGVY